MKSILPAFACVLLAMPLLAQYYGNHTVNVNGSIDLYDVARIREVKIKEKELELKRRELEMKRQTDRRQYERDMKENDAILQQEALSLNDGVCADYFDGKRCKKRASCEGFCATHYREMKKGKKDSKYRSVCNARFAK